MNCTGGVGVTRWTLPPTPIGIDIETRVVVIPRTLGIAVAIETHIGMDIEKRTHHVVGITVEVPGSVGVCC